MALLIHSKPAAGLVLLAELTTLLGESLPEPANVPNPQAITEVVNGQRALANAA
jgi:hypothetical protein